MSWLLIQSYKLFFIHLNAVQYNNNKRYTIIFFFIFFLWFCFVICYICIKLHFIKLLISIHIVLGYCHLLCRAHTEHRTYHLNWTGWNDVLFSMFVWWTYDVSDFDSITNLSLAYKLPIIICWNKEDSLNSLNIYHHYNICCTNQSYPYLSSNNIQIFISKLILFHHFFWLGQCFILSKSISDSSYCVVSVKFNRYNLMDFISLSMNQNQL